MIKSIARSTRDSNPRILSRRTNLPTDNFKHPPRVSLLAWITFSPRLFRKKTVSSRNNERCSRCRLMSRRNHSSDELSVFFSSMLSRTREKKDTQMKRKKGEREREEEEKQRRGGKKNRRVNCFPAANGRQLKLKILDYLHRAFTHVPTHVERETNVTRRST